MCVCGRGEGDKNGPFFVVVVVCFGGDIIIEPTSTAENFLCC